MRRHSLPAASEPGLRMKRTIGILCGLVLGGLALPAQAQDYYATDGGLYWGIRGGLSQVRDSQNFAWPRIPLGDPASQDDDIAPHLEHRNLELDLGYVAGASIGYTFAYPRYAGDIRVEAEAIYRYHENGQTNADWIAVEPGQAIGHVISDIDGTVQYQSAMANVLVDFHTGSRFVPFLGLGAGLTRMDIDALLFDEGRFVYGHPFPIVIDETTYALSWQAIAGLGFRLSSGTVVAAEYRYFRLANDRFSGLFRHEELSEIKFDDFSLSLRFTF